MRSLRLVLATLLCVAGGVACADADQLVLRAVPGLLVEQGPVPARLGTVFVVDNGGRVLKLDHFLNPIEQASSAQGAQQIVALAPEGLADGLVDSDVAGLMPDGNLQTLRGNGGSGMGLPLQARAGFSANFRLAVDQPTPAGPLPVLLVGDADGRVMSIEPGGDTGVITRFGVPLRDVVVSPLDAQVVYASVRGTRSIRSARVGGRADIAFADLPFEPGRLVPLAPASLLVLPATSTDDGQPAGSVALIDLAAGRVRTLAVQAGQPVALRQCARLGAGLLCADHRGALWQGPALVQGILAAHAARADQRLDPVNGSVAVQVVPRATDRQLRLRVEYSGGRMSAPVDKPLYPAAQVPFQLVQVPLTRPDYAGPMAAARVHLALVDAAGNEAPATTLPIDLQWPAYRPGVLGVKSHYAGDVSLQVEVSAYLPEAGEHLVQVEVPGPDGLVYAGNATIKGGAPFSTARVTVQRGFQVPAGHQTRDINVLIKAGAQEYRRNFGVVVSWLPMTPTDVGAGNDMAALRYLLAQQCTDCPDYTREATKRIEQLIPALAAREASNADYHRLAVAYYLRRYGIRDHTAREIMPHLAALNLLTPGDRDLPVYAAVDTVARGDDELARRMLAHARKEGAKTPWLPLLEAYMHVRAGKDFDAARKLALPVTQLPRQDPPADKPVRWAYELAAEAAAKSGRADEAVTLLQRALSTQFPDDACMIYWLAWAQVLHANRFADGIATLSRLNGRACRQHHIASLVAAAHVALAAERKGQPRRDALLAALSTGVPAPWVLQRMMQSAALRDAAPVLLEAMPDALTAQERRGFDAVALVAMYGEPVGLQRLAAMGASLERRYTDDQWSLLMLAISGGQVEVVRYLLANTRQAQVKTASGMTALDIAQYYEASPEIIALLRSVKAGGV